MSTSTMAASPPRTPARRQSRPDPRRATSDTSLFIHTHPIISPYAQAHESPRYRAASPSPNSPRAQQQQYRTSSPSPTSPHSPHPTNLHHSPLYRTASPRIPDGELARRHTTTATPTASPRRAQFGVPLPPTSPPGHLRQRSKTEPYGVAGESYGIPALEEQQQPRERPHGEGHGRKSSAYAALAALSGLGVGHPNARTGHVRGGGGSLSQSAPNGASGQVTTPGSTPPLSADVRDESASESDDGGDEDVDGHRRKRRGRGTNGRLLTPPATPPRCSLVVVGDELVCGSGGACVHDGDPRPAFNARKASAQCRQLEGYVSFAAVEGLGEPPSPGPDGDLDDEEAGKKRGSLGAGIVGFWKGGFW
ncbi:hypothetical protein B0H14DRAFT_137788 [Mycena olivaceomarginata]|nr:hypothetical protein B0H14DRAFT_137788 [Mycena olivaceomarginata]